MDAHQIRMREDAKAKVSAFMENREFNRYVIERSMGERTPLDHVGRIALVCIAKDEDRYIQEWIDYHFKLGVDDIFIYEHDWRCGLKQNRVHKIPFDGPSRHTLAYNDWLFRRAEEFDWVIFLDVDEFLVLKQHGNIRQFLHEYGNIPDSVDAIAVNWMMFGDNNDAVSEGSVRERFTRRGAYPDRHIQVIMRLNGNRMMMSPHHPFGFWIDTGGRVGWGQNNFNGDCDVIQVNHYFCKSKQEYAEKKLNQERADCNMVRSFEEFDFYNQNEVEDYTALNFL
jgi:hypothetical protein